MTADLDALRSRLVTAGHRWREALQVHANDCGGRRVKFGQHRTEAFPGALRQGFTMAPCCTAHESRLTRLARQAGTW